MQVGRFGARYGRTVRKRVLEVEARQRKKQTCLYCKRKTAKRVASGIWYCKSCKTKFSGGAYIPKAA